MQKLLLHSSVVPHSNNEHGFQLLPKETTFIEAVAELQAYQNADLANYRVTHPRRG